MSEDILRTAEEASLVILRAKEGGFDFNGAQQQVYLALQDDLGEFKEGMSMPDGYKKCGKCNHVMKFYLFNRNSGAKTNTTGNCKACQKQSASKSYEKTKHRRNYKKYYQEHREQKQAHSQKYYNTHKEALTEKHKQYHTSAKGRKVMQKAHAKRRALMQANQGIPWTREDVIDRDKQGKQFPICYYCGKPIKDTSGAKCHMDHVIPVALEGKDCFTNVASLHDQCNLTKKKDGSDITAAMISRVVKLAEDYIDEHPEKFGLADDKED